MFELKFNSRLSKWLDGSSLSKSDREGWVIKKVSWKQETNGTWAENSSFAQDGRWNEEWSCDSWKSISTVGTIKSR